MKKPRRRATYGRNWARRLRRLRRVYRERDDDGFAQKLGVSTATLKHWLSGKGKSSRLAVRVVQLLELRACLYPRPPATGELGGIPVPGGVCFAALGKSPEEHAMNYNRLMRYFNSGGDT